MKLLELAAALLFQLLVLASPKVFAQASATLACPIMVNSLVIGHLRR